MFKRLRESIQGMSPVVILVSGVGVGALGIVGFDTAMTVTSENEFCAVCHESNATAEWRESIHYRNASGAVVGCADCHIPHEFIPKMTIKVMALADVWRHWQGAIDTPEKYEARRLAMAEREWDRLAATGSKACVNCHDLESMHNEDQPHVRSMHIASKEDGEPCMECHKGIAHRAPPEPDEVEDE